MPLYKLEAVVLHDRGLLDLGPAGPSDRLALAVEQLVLGLDQPLRLHVLEPLDGLLDGHAQDVAAVGRTVRPVERVGDLGIRLGRGRGLDDVLRAGRVGRVVAVQLLDGDLARVGDVGEMAERLQLLAMLDAVEAGRASAAYTRCRCR